MRPWGLSSILAVCVVLLQACGGGGSPTTATITAPPVLQSNELALSVQKWAFNSSYPNQLYANVQICEPASNNCQTIDHVLVDTGSYGLRLFDSVVKLNLPVATSGLGQVFECTRFVSGYAWGSVRTADVVLGDLKANVPLQVVQASGSVPGNCPGGLPRLQTPSDLGANGILGVGAFVRDCGNACANSPTNGMYFSCNGTNCSGIRMALAAQVSNPVALLASDNNGVVIDLSTVQAPGLEATGTLRLGIATRDNNALSATQVLPLNANGYFTTTYKNQTMSNSYLDSGSNGLFFQDASLTVCSSGSFYCPGSPLTLSASMSAGSVSFVQNFTVNDPPGNNFAVLPHLAGTGSALSFAWGLPFFYGKQVFTAFEQRTAAGRNGPFVAF